MGCACPAVYALKPCDTAASALFSPVLLRSFFINIAYKGEHFYLNDNKFSYFDEEKKFLYIIDLSINYAINKIKINDIYNKNYEIDGLKNLCYYNLNGKEYLIYCSEASINKENDVKFESKIVKGIIF